jgi:hypothetical protein
LYLGPSQSAKSFRKVAKVLEVDRRNIRRVVKKRQLLDLSIITFWTSHQRAKRSNMLSELTNNLISLWWNIDHKDYTEAD